MFKAFHRLFQHEQAGGILLMLAATLALLISNSGWSNAYHALLDLRMEVSLGELRLGKPLELWISDGLMAIFFLVVGLEIKREILLGELRSPQRAALPAIAAIGGMALPAALYAWVNAGDPVGMRGWAIPSATDIAFALGVLSLAGKAVPATLKVLLTAIAILDDLGAILIIALFYTENLNFTMLATAGGCAIVLAALNLSGVRRIAPYVLVGAVMWVSVLKSGVHATVAGVVTALAIPLRVADGETAPAARLEEALHPWIVFGVLPLFAFANAGVSLAGLTWSHFLQPVTLGIALGLIVGKALGIFLSLQLAIGLGIAPRPAGTAWPHLLGLACLCGIGFTMSLFIGSLAFEAVGGASAMQSVRLGVLSGSVISALLGVAVLRMLTPRRE